MEKKSNKKLIFIIIGMLIVCIGIVGFIFYNSSHSEPKEDPVKGEVPEQLISYTIPDDFKINEEACYSGTNYKLSAYDSVTNDKDYIEILANGPTDLTLDKIKPDNGEKYKTKHDIDGYIYKIKDVENMYGFVFVKDQYSYTITSTDKNILTSVIDSIDSIDSKE